MSRTVPISKIKTLAALHGADKNPSVSYLARVLGLCRGSVRKYRQVIKESGYSFAGFGALPNKEILAVLKSKSVAKRPGNRCTVLPSIFSEIQEHVCDGSRNLKQNWIEYRISYPEG